MKRCLTSLDIREIQIKMPVRYYFTSSRLAIIKENKCWWGYGKCESSYASGSVQFSRVWLLATHELQYARPPCLSTTLGVYSNSCPLSQWCHPIIASSVIPFSSCLQSFPASGSFFFFYLFIFLFFFFFNL